MKHNEKDCYCYDTQVELLRCDDALDDDALVNVAMGLDPAATL